MADEFGESGGLRDTPESRVATQSVSPATSIPEQKGEESDVDGEENAGEAAAFKAASTMVAPPPPPVDPNPTVDLVNQIFTMKPAEWVESLRGQDVVGMSVDPEASEEGPQITAGFIGALEAAKSLEHKGGKSLRSDHANIISAIVAGDLGKFAHYFERVTNNPRIKGGDHVQDYIVYLAKYAAYEKRSDILSFLGMVSSQNEDLQGQIERGIEEAAGKPPPTPPLLKVL